MSISDYIYALSTHSPREIAASYCQLLYDNYEIDEAGGLVYQERVTVERQRISIDAFRYYSPEPIKQIKLDTLGFDPNLMIAIIYHNPSLEIEELRNEVLRGAAGLIKTINCSLAVSFADMYVLSYHEGELMIIQNPHFKYWTEERLRLFADIPYKFKIK